MIMNPLKRVRLAEPRPDPGLMFSTLSGVKPQLDTYVLSGPQLQGFDAPTVLVLVGALAFGFWLLNKSVRGAKEAWRDLRKAR